ncbi:MAG: hypothetical protein JXB19_04850 [Bacteroidales bacterium]|nr:hypothetical protein [Bacteroidales bacterium]
MEHTDINGFYDLRIIMFGEMANRLKKYESVLSYARLVVFIMAVAGFGLLFSSSWLLAVIVMATFLILFGWLVKYQNRIIRKRSLNEYLVRINTAEQSCLKGEFRQFPDGSEYIDKNHGYSNDLDIFGRNSLFQMINRVTSRAAGDMLSGWLLDPATVEAVYRRQEAVADLKGKVDWRQNMMAVGYQYKDAGNSPDEILNWLQAPFYFRQRKYLRPVITFISVITLLVTAAVIAGVNPFFLFLILGVNFFINYYCRKAVGKLHLLVSKSNDMLLSYSEVISMIETERFTSARLISLQSGFKGDHSASEQVKKLSRFVNKLDTRLNIMVSVVLNLFFFWDIHVCYGLEKWKQENSGSVVRWFSAMSEMEVLSSLANLHFNNPGWALPDVREGSFQLHAVDAGHPLISPGKRVCNDFNIAEAGKICLITGSNMSGKSTFLRTIGVNMVLAFAGSPVCASSFSLSPITLLTSMRVSDSLEDNTSTFYAELKRLAMIIRETRDNRRTFLLLDEMLHGTNSNDRHTGSVALMKQLIKYHATGLVATHDLALSDLEHELQGKLENYNFDVRINGEELYFDYKLNKGVCRSMNASLLMKKMGIGL